MWYIFLIFFFISANVLSAPNIIVSIKPIHSIVSNITQGVSTPKLLIKGNQSAHHFHLKPSQISWFNQADLIIAVDPSIEEGMVKLLNNIDAQRKLYVVKNSAQQPHNKHKKGEQHKAENHQDYKDYHLWLNIDAMQKFSIRLTHKLIAIDADNRFIYQANLLAFNNKLNALKTRIKKQLLPYQNTPMISYSNAFKHFIKTNKLNGLTTVVDNHEQKPSIKNILDVRKIIHAGGAQCLISGIEVTEKRVGIIVENFNIKHRNVDIIGFNYPQGSAHYFTLMQDITNKFKQCLK